MLRSARATAAARTGLGGAGSSGAIATLLGNNSTSNNAGSSAGGSASDALGEYMHPNLGLHHAAASGDVGSVKFALDNGQPHSSLLNGILPLHAACSGGNEHVVRLLLAYGADVNAPRIKPKGQELGPGAEGSTPLHFAAANGHLSVVRLLLQQGARPGAQDMEAFSADMLAAANGHQACVALLRDWLSKHGPNGLSGSAVAGSSTGPGTVAGVTSGTSRFHSPPASNAGSLGRSSASNTDLRSQRSLDHLTSAAAGVKASLFNRRNQGMLKMNSNPNLKQLALHSSPRQPSPPPLPTQQSFQSTQYWPASPARPVSPDDLSDTEDLGFSSGTTAPQPVRGSRAHDSTKRRPSLPSLFEKAAHPAASIRAALTSSTSNNASSSHSHLANLFSVGSNDAIEELTDRHGRSSSGPGGKDSSSGPPHSPNRLTSRMGGKRSLSNMLRKATGAGVLDQSPASHAPTRSQARPDDVSSATSGSGESMNRLVSQTSYSSLDREVKLSSAPPGQANFLMGQSAGASPSAVYAPNATSSPAGFAQSPLLVQLPGQRQHHDPTSPITTRQSSDALRGRSDSHSSPYKPIISSPFADTSGQTSAAGRSTTSAKILPTAHDYRPRKSSNLSATASPLGRRMLLETDGVTGSASWDVEASEHTSGSQPERSARRPRSQSAVTAAQTSPLIAHAPLVVEAAGSAALSPRARLLELERASASTRLSGEDAPFEDAQEFLGDAPVPGSDDEAGEHHDKHRLPDRLRSAAASRSPNAGRPAALHASSSSDDQGPSRQHSSSSKSSLGTRPQASNGSSPAVGSGGTQPHQPQLPRYGSSSSLSAASSSSASGSYTVPAPAAASGVAQRGASTSQDLMRLSPHDSPRRPLGSLGSEGTGLGLSAPAAVPTRGLRSPSNAGSMTSRASTSSLRSAASPPSAADQAQAILRQADQLGNEGKGPRDEDAGVSLSQMLAAYGAALAQERQSANPSPSQTAASSDAGTHRAVRRQASGTSLTGRSQLPSVAENQRYVHDNAASSVRSPPPAALALARSNISNVAATPVSPGSPRVVVRATQDTGTRMLSSQPSSGQLGATRSKAVSQAETDTPRAPPAIQDGARRKASGSQNAVSIFAEQQRTSPLPADRTNYKGLPHPPYSAGLAMPPRAAGSSTTAQTDGDLGQGINAHGGWIQSRASEDLLRSTHQLGNERSADSYFMSAQRGGIAGQGSKGSTRTPPFAGRDFDRSHSSPTGQPVHRHSPSLPTELASLSRVTDPAMPLSNNHDALLPRSSSTLLAPRAELGFPKSSIIGATTPVRSNTPLAPASPRATTFSVSPAPTASSAGNGSGGRAVGRKMAGSVSSGSSSAQGVQQQTLGLPPRSQSDLSSFFHAPPDFDPYASSSPANGSVTSPGTPASSLSGTGPSTSSGKEKEYTESITSTKSRRKGLKTLFQSMKR